MQEIGLTEARRSILDTYLTVARFQKPLCSDGWFYDRSGRVRELWAERLLMLTIGSILLVSLVFDWIGRRTGVPRVTLLVVMGVAVGPYGLGLLPTDIAAATEFISAFALTMMRAEA